MYTKFITILCVLSIVSLNRAEDYSVIMPPCRIGRLQRSQRIDCCNSQLPNSNREFVAEGNTTMVDFSGSNEDSPSVEDFFAKYCHPRAITQFYYCGELLFNITSECQVFYPSSEFKIVLFLGSRSTAEVACENDAEILKKLIPHNGFKSLLYNNDFDPCSDITQNLDTSSEMCSNIGNAISCFEEVIGDHPNKDTIKVIRETFARFKSCFDCSN